MSGADHGPAREKAARLHQELHAAADTIEPGPPVPFASLARAADRRRRIRLSVLSGAAVAAIVAGGSALAVGPTPRSTPVADGAPPPAGQASLLTSPAPSESATPDTARCKPADLSVSWSPRSHSSMPTTVYFLRFTNLSGHGCTVTGYPRLQVAGPASLRGNRVFYGPGNAALGSIPITPVTLAPGHRAVSQVGFGGEVGWTGCVSPVWRVMVPGSRSHAVRLGMPASTGALLCTTMPAVVSPVYAAGHGPALSSGSTSSPSHGPTKRQVAYAQGLVVLRQFLGEWRSRGAAKAARDFLQPEFRAPPGQPGPRLVFGKVVGFRPTSWTSPDRFTLVVDLDLRFAGDPLAWGQGRNERFVTFVRVPGTQRYLLALATGP